MWHLLEHYEMKRLSRGRAAARQGQRPRPAVPAGTDLLPQIRHIVVLMMENHSYDNYLGMLPGRGDGFPIDHGGQPEVFNRGADGEVIRAFRRSSPAQRRGVPSQSWHASHLQWGEGNNDGFVTSVQAVQSEARAGTAADVDTATEAATVGMGYWQDEDLPFYYGLARIFPLGIGRYMQHVRALDQFFADADDGTLPAFSIVDPDFHVYSEENPQDIRKGESFAAEVINRVLHGKGWPYTLLIWVYDEHGGYLSLIHI